MRTKDFLRKYYRQFLNHEKTIFLMLKNLVFQDHHLIRKHHMYFLNNSVARKFTIFLSPPPSPQKKKKLHQDYILSKKVQ